MTWRFCRHPHERPREHWPMVHVHEAVLVPTIEALQRSGGAAGPHEGVVYWAGRATPEEWLVTTCIVPEAVTTPGSFRTSAAANALVVRALAAVGLVLLAQVHSHPGSGVEHSAGDDADALMPYQGSLSLVVPHYGRTTLWPLDHCGVHRFERGRFRRLTKHEVDAAFHLVPSRIAPGRT